MLQNPASKISSLYTIESAASLMVLGHVPQIKYDGWEKDVEAKRQMLCAELRKVDNGWRSQTTLMSIIELVDGVFLNVNDNYRETFKDNITSIFEKHLFPLRQELMNDIDRVFLENRNTNPYRNALRDSIESIFGKYKDLDVYRKNVEVHIGYTIRDAIDDPDSYRQGLNNYVDRIFLKKGENKNLRSCCQEIKDSINRIFTTINKSDSFRKGLEICFENIFSKYDGLDSYRRILTERMDRIFSINNDFDSYRYELLDSVGDIIPHKHLEQTKPFYEIYNSLKRFYGNKELVSYDSSYCKSSCKLLEHGAVDKSLFRRCKHCPNGNPQYEKTSQEIYVRIRSALTTEIDKFGIFVFPDDYFIKTDVGEEIIQVRYEGIRAWLRHGFYEEIHDRFFNPVSEKPEEKSTDTAASTVDNSKSQPAKKGWKDEYSELTTALGNKYLRLNDEQLESLEEKYKDKNRQLIAVCLYLEYKLKGKQIAKIMNISETAANNHIRHLRKLQR